MVSFSKNQVNVVGHGPFAPATLKGISWLWLKFNPKTGRYDIDIPRILAHTRISLLEQPFNSQSKEGKHVVDRRFEIAFNKGKCTVNDIDQKRLNQFVMHWNGFIKTHHINACDLLPLLLTYFTEDEVLVEPNPINIENYLFEGKLPTQTTECR